LDNHDGELVPSLEVRKQIIRTIRQWKADIVIAHRPNDYHPDHRYTGVLVQDAAFMVLIPFIVPDVEPLKKNPVFLSSQDRFQKPLPFRPDIAVDIDDVWKTKVDALDAIESQVYEAQPYCWGGMTSGVPQGKAERRQWLEKRLNRPMSPSVRESLAQYYGAARAKTIQHAEAFEICEYGRQPSAAEIRQMFPFFAQ
jgi:LmbE family N-acetylglucosaminyl deacetylase